MENERKTIEAKNIASNKERKEKKYKEQMHDYYRMIKFCGAMVCLIFGLCGAISLAEWYQKQAIVIEEETVPDMKFDLQNPSKKERYILTSADRASLPYTELHMELPTMEEIEESQSSAAKEINAEIKPTEPEKPDYSDLVVREEVCFTGLKVRENPDKDSKCIGIIYEKDKVKVVSETEDGWTQILYDDNLYYVSSKYIGNDSQYKEYLEEKERLRDKTPYSNYLLTNYGFDFDKQKYMFDKCLSYTGNIESAKEYYAYLLGVMQKESDLGRDKSNYNSNGTRDLGIMQVNSCNWKELKNAGIISGYDKSSLSCPDLMDDYIGINAGMYYLNNLVSKWGVGETAYYCYNTGKNRNGSNANSRKVMKYFNEWKNRLY